jgi:dTMP kinase
MQKQAAAYKTPGRLIVVEGIDGSGKSTQLALLHRWLLNQGYPVRFTEWNSSPLVKQITKRGKDRRILTSTTFCLTHAADFADRTEREIIPALRSGGIVLSDRYMYTAFARDAVRGMDPNYLRQLYRFAIRPTLAFYFRVPLEVALGRILGGRNALKYYEAGMDLNLSGDIEESFRLFQRRILTQYELLAKEYGLIVIDATLSIEEQQAQMRAIVKQKLEGVKRLSKHGKVSLLR